MDIPQLDTHFFFSQFFWLLITFSIFYVVLSKIVIPKIHEIKKSRDSISDSLKRQTIELKKKANVISNNYKDELEAANNQVFKLINSVRDSIKNTIDVSCYDFTKNLNVQMYDLRKKLSQIEEERKSEYKHYIYDISLKIFSSIVGRDHDIEKN